MLKKTITYPNIDGVQVTEDFYFNLTKAELVKLQVRAGDDMRERLTRIAQSGNGQLIVDTFEEILRDAYGVRTADNKFVKPANAFEEFQATEAYSILFMELVTDGRASAKFIEAIMPSDLIKQAQAEIASGDVVPLPGNDVSEDTRPAWIREDRDPTKQELLGMTPGEMAEAMQRRVNKNAGG